MRRKPHPPHGHPRPLHRARTSLAARSGEYGHCSRYGRAAALRSRAAAFTGSIARKAAPAPVHITAATEYEADIAAALGTRNRQLRCKRNIGSAPHLPFFPRQEAVRSIAPSSTSEWRWPNVAHHRRPDPGSRRRQARIDALGW
jgi:hypothetical protein